MSSSAVPRSSAVLEANPNLPRSRAASQFHATKSRDGWKLGRVNTGDWAQDPQRISSFASISTVRSKSAEVF